MSRNDITGDALRSRPASDDYRAGHDRIFGKKTPVDRMTSGECELCGEWSGQLLFGICKPCGEKRNLP